MGLIDEGPRLPRTDIYAWDRSNLKLAMIMITSIQDHDSFLKIQSYLAKNLPTVL
jgi:hypothetical protein